MSSFKIIANLILLVYLTINAICLKEIRQQFDMIKDTQSEPKVYSNLKIDINFYKYQKIKLFSNPEIKCSEDKCPSSRGKCISDTVCECKAGRVDIVSLSEISETICHYSQKRMLIALVLESLFLFGFGHLYTSRIVIGLLKLLFGLYGLYCYYKLTSKNESKLNCIHYTCYVGMFLCAHAYDIMNFWKYQYTDGNGIELY